MGASTGATVSTTPAPPPTPPPSRSWTSPPRARPTPSSTASTTESSAPASTTPRGQRAVRGPAEDPTVRPRDPAADRDPGSTPPQFKPGYTAGKFRNQTYWLTWRANQAGCRQRLADGRLGIKDGFQLSDCRRLCNSIFFHPSFFTA